MGMKERPDINDTLRDEGVDAVRARHDRARKFTNGRDPHTLSSPPPLSAEALSTMTFQPIKYVVPGIIVEGLTLFAGKPKLGKSWLLLHAAVAVARGGFTLGDIHCMEGDVLYCALEDNLRRLQSRMTKLFGVAQSWPKRLKFLCEMPRLAEGGIDALKAWIKSVDRPRLVIIDTLAMVRMPNKRDQGPYDADYTAVKDLRALAHEHNIAIVLCITCARPRPTTPSIPSAERSGSPAHPTRSW